MKKVKTKISAFSAVALLLTFAAIMLAASVSAVAADASYNVSSLFYAKEGYASGRETVSAANADNLPQYLYDQTVVGFQSDFVGTGANVLLSKNTSHVVTNVFSLSDNTANVKLASFLPAGKLNRYYEEEINGGNGISASEAYNRQLFPSIRDITLKIVDAYDENNFVTVEFQWQTGVNTSYHISRLYAYATGQKKAAERGDGNLRPHLGGALMAQSYWMKNCEPFTVYYDYAENALYADICDAGGTNIRKELVRDFDKAYDSDGVTWSGFKSNAAYLEFYYTGGYQDSNVLVHEIDGLNLSTDADGNLSADNVNAYLENAEDAYSVQNQEYVVGGTSLPLMAKSNVFGVGSFDAELTAQFSVAAFDEKGSDVTAAVITGLKDGKWTSDAKIVTEESGKYVLEYTKDEVTVPVPIAVGYSKKTVSGLFSSATPSAYSFSYNQSTPEYMTSGELANMKGIKLTFTEDFTLDFGNAISVRLFTEKKPIISYVVTPAQKAAINGSKSSDTDDEFDSIRIRLSDWEDPTQYIDLFNNHSAFGANMSFATASAYGQTYANNKTKKTFDKFSTNNGEAITTSFTGNATKPTEFCYDAASGEVYVAPDYYTGKAFKLRDLNDPKQLIYSKERIFEGFPSGKVRLSLTFSGLRTASASVMFFSLCGQTLLGEQIEDVTAPEIIDVNGVKTVQPKAEVGKEYPMPALTAYDFIDGDLTDKTEFNVYYCGADGNVINEVAVSDGKFIPTRKGNYKIVARLSDRAQNETAEEFTFTAVDKIEFMTVELSEEYPRSSEVGTTVKLPSFVPVGGSGAVKTEVSVTAPDGASVDLTQNSFEISKQGMYVVSYSLTDYLGTQKVAKYYVFGSYSKAPIIRDVTVPPAIIGGKTVILPRPEAYDFTSFIGQRRNASVDVYVTEEGKERVKLGDDMKYTPSIERGEVKIEYEAAAVLDKSNKVTATYYTEVIKPEKMGDYFVLSGGTEVNYVRESEVMSPETVFSSVRSGASLTFVNKLPSDNFSVTIRGAANSKLTSATVTLVDSINPSERIDMKFTALGNTVTAVEYNGKYAEMSGSFKAGNNLRLRLRNNKRLFDSDNANVMTFDETASGETFNGFSSNRIYMTVTFDKIEDGGEAKICLRDLINQPRFGESVEDRIMPFISVVDDYSLYHNFGSTVTLSRAYSIDIIDPSSTVSLTVTSPSGKTILSGADCDVNHDLHLTEYGVYVIRYTATDASFNVSTRAYNLVSTDDVAPAIEISGTVKTEYKAGEKLVVNEARASDNVTPAEKMSVYVILIEDASGKIKVVGKDDDVTLSASGTYTLRYFVEDEFGNYGKHDFKITVTA